MRWPMTNWRSKPAGTVIAAAITTHDIIVTTIIFTIDITTITHRVVKQLECVFVVFKPRDGRVAVGEGRNRGQHVHTQGVTL